jgi:hypothetical protein
VGRTTTFWTESEGAGVIVVGRNGDEVGLSSQRIERRKAGTGRAKSDSAPEEPNNGHECSSYSYSISNRYCIVYTTHYAVKSKSRPHSYSHSRVQLRAWDACRTMCMGMNRMLRSTRLRRNISDVCT